MDTNDRNKSLIRIKMLHVNTSFRRFWSNTASLERIFIPNKMGGLCQSFFQPVSMCTYSDCVFLVGLKLSLLHMPTLRFMLCSCLLSCELYRCRDGLNICIIVGQQELPSSPWEDRYVSLSKYFWVSQNWEIMYKFLYYLNNYRNSIKLRACGKVASVTRLSADTSCSSGWGNSVLPGQWQAAVCN